MDVLGSLVQMKWEKLGGNLSLSVSLGGCQGHCGSCAQLARKQQATLNSGSADTWGYGQARWHATKSSPNRMALGKAVASTTKVSGA